MNDKLLRQVVGGVTLLLILVIVIRWFNGRETSDSLDAALQSVPGQSAMAEPTDDEGTKSRVYRLETATKAVRDSQPASSTEDKSTPEDSAAGAPAAPDELSAALAAEGASAANQDAGQVAAQSTSAAQAENKQALEAAAPVVTPAPAPAATPPAVTSKPPVAQKGGTHVVQIGSYSNSVNAESLIKSLKSKGYPVQVEEAVMEGKKIYRVRVGPYSEATARQQSAALRDDLKQSVSVMRR